MPFCRYCTQRRERARSRKIVRRRTLMLVRLLAYSSTRVTIFCRFTIVPRQIVSRATKRSGTWYIHRRHSNAEVSRIFVYWLLTVCTTHFMFRDLVLIHKDLVKLFLSPVGLLSWWMLYVVKSVQKWIATLNINLVLDLHSCWVQISVTCRIMYVDAVVINLLGCVNPDRFNV